MVDFVMTDEEPEGEQIPWDVFFYRNPVIRNITEDGITRQELWHPPTESGKASAFMFPEDSTNFWLVELKALIDQTNSVIYQVKPVDLRVWGDGVRLRLPYLWLLDTEEDDIIAAIIAGIKVSLQHRSALGY